MIAALVDTQRTDMYKMSQRAGRFDRVQKVFEPADIDRAVVVNRPPVADFGGTMHNQSRPRHGAGERAGIGQLAFGPLHCPLVEKPGVAPSPHQSAHPQPMS